MPTADYKTIFASVRPHRVAVLVDRSDPDWRDTCLRIIEFYSTIWGGKYNIIVPTDGETISPTFWKILEAFDPDYLYVYSKTLLDLKLAKPSQYNDILDRETDKWMAESSPGADRDESRRMIDKELSRAFVSKLEISQELQNELKQRLAPFYFELLIVEAGGIGAESEGNYPLTSILKLLPNIDHPKEITLVDAPEDLTLWSSAVTGRVHDKYAEGLKGIGISVVVEPFGDRLWDLFNRVVSAWTDVDHNSTALPFNVSMSGIGLYRSLKYKYWEEPAVAVVGDTLDDFCLYYSLSRMRERVSWLLPAWFPETGPEEGQIREGHGARYSHALSSLLWERNHANTATLVSVSLDRSELEKFQGRFEATFGRRALSGQIDVQCSVDEFVRHPLVAYDQNNVSRDVTKQFLDGELPSFFETPKPKNVRSIDPAEHRWISELAVKDHYFPRHPSLGKWVIRDRRLGTHGARAGRSGIAYLCPNIGYFGGDIDTILVKPSLFVPDAIELFTHLAQEVGLHCKLSDKGLYAHETIRKFGGLGNVASFLRNERWRCVIEKFLDTSRPGKEVHDDGVFLTSDRRRYLNFASLEKIIGTADDTSTLIDDLIRAGVFYRGFIFKCSSCRNADWFVVDEVTEEFKCKRCGRQQLYTRTHWLHPHEPGWFYKLDEIVYQGLRNDMIVPLLALDCLRRNAPDSFLYTNDLEFSESGESAVLLETDLCCVPESKLTIGEAKRENRLAGTAVEEERTIVRYRDLAKKLGANQVVFATASDSWSEATKEKIARNFQGSHAAAILLTKSDLFS
jgi:hypothetical protein